MAQTFHPAFNTIAKASIFGAVFIVAVAGWVLYEVYWSPYVTRAGEARPQPVPFSHEHHVRGLGIDCRFCHTTVEKSSFAGLPPTKTCMTCHSQVWKDAPMLQPVRDSWANDTPIPWTRVHNLPDYVYFDHSIHVAKGVGCSTCHGQVERMPLMAQHASLYMKWCLDCHKAPEKYVRPADRIFDMDWEPGANQESEGLRLVRDVYHIKTGQITNCSVCHR